MKTDISEKAGILKNTEADKTKKAEADKTKKTGWLQYRAAPPDNIKRNDLPINKINYGVYYKYIIKNTFKEVLKKAMLNKVLISKKEIREEYQRQINGMKQYLNVFNKENKDNKSDLTNNQNLKSLVINNSSSYLIPKLNENKKD